jgi:hypothetical protein
MLATHAHRWLWLLLRLRPALTPDDRGSCSRCAHSCSDLWGCWVQCDSCHVHSEARFLCSNISCLSCMLRLWSCVLRLETLVFDVETWENISCRVVWLLYFGACKWAEGSETFVWLCCILVRARVAKKRKITKNNPCFRCFALKQ